MSNSEIEQSVTVKGNLPNEASLSGRISNGLSLSGHISIGSGTSDFIIKMTVASDDDGNYTVASCDATVEQIDAAVAAEKRVVVIATDTTSGIIFELPMLEGVGGDTYYFGAVLLGQTVTSFVQKIDESTSEWQFLMAQIEAGDISYSNDALPNRYTVRGALDELVPKSHSHDNKDTLDKLSVLNGKLQYNGSDVGLKGTNGITPHIGDNGNWYIGSTDTGKPSHGVAGAKGDTGAPGKDGVSPTVSTVATTGGTKVTITDAKGSHEFVVKDGAKGADGANGKDGADGEKGADGKTPIKGTDYWTAADKQEIVDSVIAALPDGTEVSY